MVKEFQNESLDEARFLWDEYRYRHEHCWNLVFKITAAVVAILIVPYVKPEITQAVGRLIMALPVTALALVLFSYYRLERELDVLAKVKNAHRRRQKTVFPDIGHEEHESTFLSHVQWYLRILACIAIAEGIALAISIPRLPASSYSSPSYLSPC